MAGEEPVYLIGCVYLKDNKIIQDQTFLTMETVVDKASSCSSSSQGQFLSCSGAFSQIGQYSACRLRFPSYQGIVDVQISIFSCLLSTRVQKVRLKVCP